MINNLQFLRAIAAYAVVVHHVRVFINNIHPGAAYSNLGAAGVDVFFIVSGFIMVYTNQSGTRTPTQFWRERIIRIVPMYWLATFGLVALSLIGFRPVGLHGWSGPDLLASLLLIPNVRIDGVPEPILSVGWTLIYEMMFYFVFGWLLLFKDQAKAAMALTVLFLTVWVAGLLLQPAGFAARYYTSPLSMEFAAGCLLGVAYTRSSIFAHPMARNLGLAAICFGVAALLLVDLRFRDVAARSQELQIVCVGLPALLLVGGALALERCGVRCTDRSLLLAGAASYSIYLIHPLIIHVVYKSMSHILPLGSPAITAAMTLAAIVASGVVGTAMHLWLEKPVGGVLTRWWSARTSANAASPASRPQVMSQT